VKTWTLMLCPVQWCIGVRVHGHPAWPAAAGDDSVDAGRSQRPPDVTVEAAGRPVADLDGPGRAALAADPDLPGVQVKVAAGGVAGVVADAGQFGQVNAGRGEHRDDRGVAARGERPVLAGLAQFR